MTPGLNTAIELARLQGWQIKPLHGGKHGYVVHMKSNVVEGAIRTIQIYDDACGLQTLCDALARKEEL